MKTALCGKYEQLVHYDCASWGEHLWNEDGLVWEYEQLVHYGANMANVVEQT